MRARSIKAVTTLAILASMLFTAAACGSGDEDAGARERPLRLYGTDGNMSNSFGAELKDQPGVLAGMKGTTPLTPLSEDFKRRLRAVDGSLADFNYAGESYDAVLVAAFAAEMARTVDPPALAKQLIGITSGGTACETVATCMVLARSGRDFYYRGVSLRRSGLTEAGEPSSATYGALNFGRDNRIDDAKTEFVASGDDKTEYKQAPPAVTSTKPGKTTIPLKFGSLLPKTGDLALQGPPMFAGIGLAIRELNETGGVLGMQVTYEEGDDGTTVAVANATIDRLITGGAHVIIGAGASGVSKAVLPKVVAANRVMISPSATSDELTRLDDKGLFFRTSPPDILQAKALADIIMRDGPRSVAIVAREDSYGTGLQSSVRDDLKAAGIKDANIKSIKYVASATEPAKDYNRVFVPIAKDLKKFAPDAVLIIGFGESALVIKALLGEKVPIHA